jgi:hypothetical protein
MGESTGTQIGPQKIDGAITPQFNDGAERHPVVGQVLPVDEADIAVESPVKEFQATPVAIDDSRRRA